MSRLMRDLSPGTYVVNPGTPSSTPPSGDVGCGTDRPDCGRHDAPVDTICRPLMLHTPASKLLPVTTAVVLALGAATAHAASWIAAWGASPLGSATGGPSHA